MSARVPPPHQLPVEVGVLDGYTIALTIEVFRRQPSLWWHAWSPSGSYAGQSNSAQWLVLLIAQHRQTTA